MYRKFRPLNIAVLGKWRSKLWLQRSVWQFGAETGGQSALWVNALQGPGCFVARGPGISG
jgi:hypothetical protein